jgi:hypothetical protein
MMKLLAKQDANQGVPAWLTWFIRCCDGDRACVLLVCVGVAANMHQATRLGAVVSAVVSPLLPSGIPPALVILGCCELAHLFQVTVLNRLQAWPSWSTW